MRAAQGSNLPQNDWKRPKTDPSPGPSGNNLNFHDYEPHVLKSRLDGQLTIHVGLRGLRLTSGPTRTSRTADTASQSDETGT
jgi:hypothetical protein